MKFHRNLCNNGNVKPPTSLRQHRHHRQMIPSGSSSCSFSCAGPRTYSWKWRWTQWPWPANDTWWLIPLSKWDITPVISGLTLLIPFITGVITHLLSGMSHQVGNMDELMKNFGSSGFFQDLESEHHWKISAIQRNPQFVSRKSHEIHRIHRYHDIQCLWFGCFSPC